MMAFIRLKDDVERYAMHEEKLSKLEAFDLIDWLEADEEMRQMKLDFAKELAR